MNIIGSLLAFALGAVGWLAVEFIGRPVKDFFVLRREIRRQVIFLGNIGPLEFFDSSDVNLVAIEEHCEIVAKAATTLRDLGAQAIAFDQADWFASRAVHWLGLRPMEAGKNLIGLANSLENETEATAHRVAIEKALRFESIDKPEEKYMPSLGDVDTQFGR